jgi:hypothetical protein
MEFKVGDKVKVTCNADGTNFIGIIVQMDNTGFPYRILDNDGDELWGYSNANNYTLEPVEDKPESIPLSVGCRVRIVREGTVTDIINDGQVCVELPNGAFGYLDAKYLTVLAPPPEPAKPEPWCKVGDWMMLASSTHAMKIVRVEWDGNEWVAFSISDVPWYKWNNLKKVTVTEMEADTNA